MPQGRGVGEHARSHPLLGAYEYLLLQARELREVVHNKAVTHVSKLCKTIITFLTQ
jgi:hypothetical protein